MFVMIVCNKASADDEDFGDPVAGTAFPIDDQVDGFTNQQIFQSWNSNTTDLDDYRIFLINNFLGGGGTAGTTQAEMNQLFNDYGL